MPEMKSANVFFKRPVHLLQVYRRVLISEKGHRPPQYSSETLAGTTIQSCSGLVSKGELFVPPSVVDDPDFNQMHLLTLEDDVPCGSLRVPDETRRKGTYDKLNHCFNLVHTRRHHIFKVSAGSPLTLDLVEWNYWKLGIPKRDAFPVYRFELPTVEVLINGKWDSTSSSGSARRYLDQIYVYQYLGMFERATIMTQPHGSTMKKIPMPDKRIDLRKPIW